MDYTSTPYSMQEAVSLIEEAVSRALAAIAALEALLAPPRP
jgi:hypothetical protein